MIRGRSLAPASPFTPGSSRLIFACSSSSVSETWSFGRQGESETKSRDVTSLMWLFCGPASTLYGSTYLVDPPSGPSPFKPSHFPQGEPRHAVRPPAGRNVAAANHPATCLPHQHRHRRASIATLASCEFPCVHCMREGNVDLPLWHSAWVNLTRQAMCTGRRVLAGGLPN